MDSRERVQLALNHEKPDRTPIEIGGIVTTLTYGAYQNFVRYFGIQNPQAVIGGFKAVWNIEEEILQRLHSDFRTLFFQPVTPDWKLRENADGTLTDRWGIVSRDVGDYYEMIEYPLAGDCTVEDLDRFNWPDFKNAENFAGLDQRARELYEHTEYSLIGTFGVHVLERAQWLRGLEDQLTDLYINEEFAEALLEKMTELSLDYLRNYLPLVRDYIDVMAYGDDLATQQSLMLSPDIYRRMVKPRQARIFEYIKQNSDAKIFYHCCGAGSPLFHDLAEIGVDIINPIQPLAANMDFDYLKKEFGKELVFWGAIDEQALLPHGTPEDVCQGTKFAIDKLGRDGGYVCAPAHNIQSDVPVENILAMCDCAAEYHL